MADHVNASLNRILRSGEYVCRPARQIFVEHTFTNKAGQVTRQATKADLDAIAANCNAIAVSSSKLAKLGIGHTFDDIFDEKGDLVRKFSEAEQPVPIGYLHNYYVAQRSDGKWALYADQWVQKVINIDPAKNDPVVAGGTPVDGLRYVETFPERSVEYLSGKKEVDWLALLRRTPALNMGLDISAYAILHPDKALYRYGNDGASLVGAIVDSRGKLRYAHEEDAMDPNKPDAPSGAPPAPGAAAACPPPNSPAAPPDDRPPLPASDTNDPMSDPLHQEAAQRYMAHCTGMHHSQVKPLLHHMHAMYSTQLGLPGDKMAEHVPPPAPAAPPGAAPGAPTAPAPAASPAAGPPPAAPAPATPPATPPHEKHNAPVAGPGVGPAFIPGSEEHKRMSAVQAGIEQQITADRYQELRTEVDSLKLDKARAEYERDLLPLSYRYQFDLSVEVERMAKHRYAKPACEEQIATIKACYRERDNPPIGGGFIQTDEPVGVAGTPKSLTYDEKTKAVKYAANHGISFDEALVKIRGA